MQMKTFAKNQVHRQLTLMKRLAIFTFQSPAGAVSNPNHLLGMIKFLKPRCSKQQDIFCKSLWAKSIAWASVVEIRLITHWGYLFPFWDVIMIKFFSCVGSFKPP